MNLKRHYWLPLTLLLVLSGAVVAEEAAKEELKVPSAEVIKSFVTTSKDKPDGKTTFQFNASFKPAMLPAKSMELYRSKGKMPFAISVELLKTITTADGPEEQNVFDATANIVVVDAEIKIVSKAQEDLSALCPS